MDRVTGSRTRTTVDGFQVDAFVPFPLPPSPPLELTGDDHELIQRAALALGRLDSVTSVLPDPRLFIYFYIRKEALLSSQIEGTQSSFSDLLLFESEEAPGVPIEDVQEVSSYVAAMEHGLKRLREGFPLSLRLLREIHGILLSKGRGASKRPGEFRTTQNWVGGSRADRAIYVPPPPQEVGPSLDALEKFLHNDPVRTSTLIKAALCHVQFETIHPFLDGNGRLGRLLITFLLCAEGVLAEPSLYLSLYLKTHRATYYDYLQRVRNDGDWEGWIRFFMTGVLETAEQAVATAKTTLALFDTHRAQIAKLGRAAGSVLRVHDHMQQKPLFNIAETAKALSLSPPTVAAAIEQLEKLGLVKEITKKERNRIFSYEPYVALLNQGTEPLRE